MRYSYWPYKEPIDQLLSMERGEGTDAEGSRMSRHVFAGQYMQSPKAIGGNIIKGVWFPRYKILPKIKYRKIFVDTAQKTKERNDYSVLTCAGLGEDSKAYALDMIRGKWEAPELERRAISFWNKHAALAASTPAEVMAAMPWLTIPGEAMGHLGQLRQMIVEDKMSGTGLIQKIKLINAFPIHGIERVIDKLTRVMDVVGYWEQGMLCLPEEAPWTDGLVSECEAFTADDSHAFDDQIDTIVDATVDLLSSKNKLSTWERLL